MQKPHFLHVLRRIDATAIIVSLVSPNEHKSLVRILRHHTWMCHHHKNSQHQLQQHNQPFLSIVKTIKNYKIKDLINWSSFYMAWVFSICSIYFWFGIIILRILMERATHKNSSLPLQVMLNIYPCTK